MIPIFGGISILFITIAILYRKICLLRQELERERHDYIMLDRELNEAYEYMRKKST